MSVVGRLVCLNEREFSVCFKGWKRSPPLLAEPVPMFNPLTREMISTRIARPRPLADPDAVERPDLEPYSAEVVDALGPEALEVLGVALELWSSSDGFPRVTGLSLSGPDRAADLVYELPAELTERLATLSEEDLGRLAQAWLERIEQQPEEAWPGVLELEKYEDFLDKLMRSARVAREQDAAVYLSVNI